MADDEFPPDLLNTQRACWDADARAQEVTATLPPASAAVVGTAAVTDGQRAELARVREARLLALETLNRNPWATAEDRHGAWMWLQKALKAGRGSD